MNYFFCILLYLSPSFGAESFIPKNFSANFEQIYYGQIATKNKKRRQKREKGTIDYQFPSHIVLTTGAPNEIVFVSNSKTSWYYRPPMDKDEWGDVTISSRPQNELTQFFDVIKTGLKTNENYQVLPNGNIYTFVFSKSAISKLNLKEAKLVFQKEKEVVLKNIEKIELIYSDGKEVTLSFSKIEYPQNFSKEHFEFAVPKNTNVTVN